MKRWQLLEYIIDEALRHDLMLPIDAAFLKREIGRDMDDNETYSLMTKLMKQISESRP